MQAGRLSVIAGPMFAGKTEALLDRVAAVEAEGQAVEVFKPTTDTRWPGTASVISHAKRSHGAHWMSPDGRASFEGDKPVPIYTKFKQLKLIAIDEAQFLTLPAVASVMAAVAAGVDVVLAGLDLTWKAEPFGNLPTFMALADEVVKLRARCACGKPACRSYRLVQSEETVLVGGAEAYEPRCLSCFLMGG